MTLFENEQLRITPSFTHPILIPFAQLLIVQFCTTTRSHGLFSASERLLARTTIESSPDSMMQSEMTTSRDQCTCTPSLLG